MWSGLLSGALSLVLAPRLRRVGQATGAAAHLQVRGRARRTLADFAGTPCSLAAHDSAVKSDQGH